MELSGGANDRQQQGIKADSVAADHERVYLGSVAVEPAGARFTSGIEHTFPEGTVLAPGARLVLVEGQYGGSLSDGGERVTLVAKDESTIRDFVYDDAPPWPTAADGEGASLVLIAPLTNPDHSDPANWRASAAAGGSPGTSDETLFSGNPLADLDGDGLSAFAEHAFGTSDTAADANPVRVAAAGDHLEITFPRGAAADDVRYVVEYSTDLVNWESGVTAVQPITLGPPMAKWRAVPLQAAV